MATRAVQPAALVTSVMPAHPLLRVCSLLNEADARYIVCGGHAVILHGFARTTDDVDILIEPTEENAARVIAALSRLEDGAAKELTPRDLLENVVNIADEVQVDVSVRAWKVTYAEAQPGALETIIDGVRVPYLGLASLIASKETYREKDEIDLLYLRTQQGGR